MCTNLGCHDVLIDFIQRTLTKTWAKLACGDLIDLSQIIGRKPHEFRTINMVDREQFRGTNDDLVELRLRLDDITRPPVGSGVAQVQSSSLTNGEIPVAIVTAHNAALSINNVARIAPEV